MEPKVARARVAELFRKNANVQDERVVRVLVSKGYMELEETMLQYKQTTHLMRLLDPRTVRYRVQALNPDPRSREDRNEYFRRAIDLPPRS
jgi:flagellar biosynthesis regulator FlbT